MDQSQEAFETLNKTYSNQLNAVDDDQNASETEKSKQTIDILMKWRDSLIKYNKSCMETIVNSSQILESASEGSFEGPTTVRMSPMDCYQQIDAAKSAVKQMGLRSKEVLNEMKSFVATFEHQFQVNKKLYETNKMLESELDSAKTKTLKLAEWSSKINEENEEFKGVVATKMSSDRTESDSFLITLNLKNQEIRDLTKNLYDVKKALHSQISVRSSSFNRISRNHSQNPMNTSTPIARGRSPSKNETDELSYQLENCTSELSRLKQENAELKQEIETISKDFSIKYDKLQAESDAKEYEMSELNQRLLSRTSTRTNVNEPGFQPMEEAVELNNSLTHELETLKLQLAAKNSQIIELHDLLKDTEQRSSSKDVTDAELKRENDIISKNELETLKLELAEKNKQIQELNRDLMQKTQQLASSTFVLERNAMSRSQSKDGTDELSRRLENCTAELAMKNLEINDLTQKLQKYAANQTSPSVLSAQKPRSNIDELSRRLENCTAELAAKNQKLNVLTQKFTANSLPQDTSNIPTKLPILTGENRQNLYQIESDDSNLTDAEALDAAKVRTLQKGYRTMASLIKEKYDQLRNQRDEINDLRYLLDQHTKTRGSNANRMLKAVNPYCNNCDQLKEQLSKNSRENKFQIEIYSHKLYLQEGQIASLMADSQRLLQKHANLMKCIALCHQELSRCTSAN